MAIYDYLKSYTAQALRVSALNRVTANVDKREGSVIYDTVSPLSVVAANIIDMMRIALANTDLQTASGQWLDLVGQQPPCGVYRTQAVKAIKIAVAHPSGVVIANDTLFKSNEGLGLVWRVTDSLGSDQYLLTCETAGAVGGSDYGALTPNVTVQNLDSIEFADEPPFNPGADEESDDDFRLRIWEALKTDAYGGNFADYKAWVLREVSNNGPSFDGMMFYPSTRYSEGGNIKIFPTQTNGYKYLPAMEQACVALKAYIDPDALNGLGAGMAPVGHRVDIEPPSASLWTLRITVTMKTGYVIDDYVDKARDRVETYFEVVRSNLVSKIGDSFPNATGSAAGYKATITKNNIIGYLIPEVECFESVVKVERLVNQFGFDEYIEIDSVTYDPTALSSSLPVINNIEFVVASNV